MGLATVYLLLFAGLAGVSNAVQVPFEDCLKSRPGATHFKPFSVDAKFGDEADGYPLTIEVHGNLTGPGQVIRNFDERQNALSTWARSYTAHQNMLIVGYSDTAPKDQRALLYPGGRKCRLL